MIIKSVFKRNNRKGLKGLTKERVLGEKRGEV